MRKCLYLRRFAEQLAISMQRRRCALAADHGLSALYARALDEVALLLFSVADYPLAEASWNERLARTPVRVYIDKGESTLD